MLTTRNRVAPGKGSRDLQPRLGGRAPSCGRERSSVSRSRSLRMSAWNLRQPSSRSWNASARAAAESSSAALVMGHVQCISNGSRSTHKGYFRQGPWHELRGASQYSCERRVSVAVLPA